MYVCMYVPCGTALTKILKYADAQDGSVGFDRIVIDTAPTGHTIRLLQLPEFLSNLTVKLIRFRSKLSSAMSSFKKLFGGNSDKENSAEVQMEKLLVKLEALQSDLLRVKSTLKDESSTQFVVVCIPTQLAVAESRRLVESLQSENIYVSTILCNQVMAAQADLKYVENRVRGQQRAISGLKSFLSSSSSSSSKAIEVTEVGYVDTEVTGVYGLRFFHRFAHPNEANMVRRRGEPLSAVILRDFFITCVFFTVMKAGLQPYFVAQVDHLRRQGRSGQDDFIC